jgi:hypothetical protein
MIRSVVRGLFLCSLLIAPATAAAQSDSGSPAWFVGGLGGMTFGTVTSGAVGGQVGFKVAPNLFIIGEAGRIRNVTPRELQDELDLFIALLEIELGVPVSFDVSLPVTYGFGGIRWQEPGRSLAPFAEGGVGFGHISLKIDKASVLGLDLSNEVEEAVGDEANETKILFAFGGGVTTALGEAARLDIGYRYTRIAAGNPAINSSMVYAAVKFGR